MPPARLEPTTSRLMENTHTIRPKALGKLQEAIDEEACLKEQIFGLMHCFAERFTNRRVKINRLMTLHDDPLIDYGIYALGCMTGADMKKTVHLKSVRDELLRSMEENKGVPKDLFPKSSEFNAEHFATLVTHPAPFHKYPKPFLCLVGISRYYTLDEDTYPEFLGDNGEGGNGFALFYSERGPYKSEVAERQRVENKPRLLESTVGRRGSVATKAPKKKKTVVADASGPSYPPKKLREDYGAMGGASTAGKSRSAVQSLFTGAVLNAEARGEPIPPLPFVTSSVSATPERKDKSPADSVTGLNLQTIGAPQRFVISSDSSHHSGANIAEAEVDSIFRSSVLAVATVTTVIAAVDADTTADRVPIEPSLFGVGSSSTGRTDSVPEGFSDVSGSDFLICDEFAPLKFFASVHWMDYDKLFTEFNVGAARKISLSAEVRMHAEYNIREKRKLRTVVDEQAKLLKVRDGKIETLLYRERNELSVKVSDLSASVKVREQEVANLDAQVTAIKLQNDNLVDQVHELDISQRDQREKVAAYEDFIGKLEKFQDKKWRRCLNSTEYMSALGAVISKAIEKGMQEGLSAGITHGTKARKLADVAAYNLSAEADYLSALQRLQNVNFSLIAKLKSNKDASVDTIMNLLCLDDALAERMGLTESQPHANQLMVPIHHSPDQSVIGAF
nr:transposase (putative), gypsy type [Tanacetum cinerariifolium]